MADRGEVLIARFGEEIAARILRHEIWVGATDEMLRESIGDPVDSEERVLKKKTRHTYKYSSTGRNRYALRVTLEQGEVTGWEGRPEVPGEAIEREAQQRAEFRAAGERRAKERQAAEERRQQEEERAELARSAQLVSQASYRLVEERIAADALRTVAVRARADRNRRIRNWLFVIVAVIFLANVVRWRCFASKNAENEPILVPAPAQVGPSTPSPEPTSTSSQPRSPSPRPTPPRRNAVPSRDAGGPPPPTIPPEDPYG